jgi:hypothetical protein
MKIALLKEYERLFKRTPFKAATDTTSITADEQQWFVWAYRRKAEPDLVRETVDDWTPKELGDAIIDFFGATSPTIPS